MNNEIGANRLTVSKKEENKALKESVDYIHGFYHGYATCKNQAIKAGYHKHPKPATPKKKGNKP